MAKFFSLFVMMALVLLPLIMMIPAYAFDCFHALQDVIPCQDYLVNGVSKPNEGCCKGVKDLATIANESSNERQSLCICLKSAAQHFPINEGKAKAMPKLCNVNLDITLAPNIDCNK